MDPEYEWMKELVESKKVWRFEPEEWAEEQWEPFEALPILANPHMMVMVTNPLDSVHSLGQQVWFDFGDNNQFYVKATLADEEAQRNHIEYRKGPYHGYWTKDDERNRLVTAAADGDPSLFGEMNEEEKKEYERIREEWLEFWAECERDNYGMKPDGDPERESDNGSGGAG